MFLIYRDWSGTCYLAHLVPTLSVYSELTEREVSKSGHRAKQACISKVQGFFGTLFPWLGTTYNVRRINDISEELENLISLVDQGFMTLTSESQALCTMTLQNRMALDFLLAVQGGVCAVIGEEYCTFVPDPTSNTTAVHTNISALADRQQKNSSSSWNNWNWFTDFTGWRAWLQKIGVFLLFVLVILMILSCCVIPRIKSMVNCMFSTTLLGLEPQTDYTSLLSGPEPDENYDSVDHDEIV